MDTSGIFNALNTILELSAAGVGTYVVLSAAVEIYDGLPFHKRIKSQEELDKVVQEESKKLGLDHAKIIAHYNEWPDAVMKTGGIHVLYANGNSTRNTVSHELYHVFRRHCKDRLRFGNSILNDLDYYFRREPQATLYGTFGIRI